MLGDGVAFATKDLRANIVVDLATLTGSQTVTTGQKFNPIFLCNMTPLLFSRPLKFLPRS